jgi:hypothetical protein
VLRDGTLHPVPVRTGLSSDTTTAILDGALREDDLVVTASSVSGAPVGSIGSSPLMPTGRGGRR